MRYFAAGLIAMALCACSSMQPVPVDAASVSRLEPGSLLLVTPASGAGYAVRYKALVGDTLTGIRHDKVRKEALTDIESLRAKRFSAKRTFITIGSIVAGIAFGVFVVVTGD
jgi:hypothetical protein